MLSFPYSPEPLEQLKARYPKALAHAFTSRAAVLQPANVFDFEDGLRIIVTRERYLLAEQVHASAGGAPHGPMVEMLGNAMITKTEFLLLVREHLEALSGKDGWRMVSLGPPHGVPHFYHESRR